MGGDEGGVRWKGIENDKHSKTYKQTLDFYFKFENMMLGPNIMCWSELARTTSSRIEQTYELYHFSAIYRPYSGTTLTLIE